MTKIFFSLNLVIDVSSLSVTRIPQFKLQVEQVFQEKNSFFHFNREIGPNRNILY